MAMPYISYEKHLWEVDIFPCFLLTCAYPAASPVLRCSFHFKNRIESVEMVSTNLREPKPGIPPTPFTKIPANHRAGMTRSKMLVSSLPCPHLTIGCAASSGPPFVTLTGSAHKSPDKVCSLSNGVAPSP